jgi:hypothetical protein
MRGYGTTAHGAKQTFDQMKFKLKPAAARDADV